MIQRRVLLSLCLGLGGVVPGFSSPSTVRQDLLKSYVDQKLKANDANWLKVTRLVASRFPGPGRILVANGICRVWKVGNRYAVFESGTVSTRAKVNVVILFWFDDQTNSIGEDLIPLGGKTRCVSAERISVPGISQPIIRTLMSRSETSDPVEVDYGLVGRNPILVRYVTLKGIPIQNRYDRNQESFSPRIAAYTKETLLAALRSSNVILAMEALMWLAGRHTELVGQPNIAPQEQNSEIYRFMTLPIDPEVRREIQALTRSRTPWVANDAVFALKNIIGRH